MESIRNLSPKTVPWLEAAGIHSFNELKQIGAVVVYAQVRQQQKWRFPQLALGAGGSDSRLRLARDLARGQTSAADGTGGAV